MTDAAEMPSTTDTPTERASHWAPPYNKAAEEVVIAAGLEYGHARFALDLSEFVSPDDFYVPRNRQVFAAMLSLIERGEPVDPLFIEDYLTTHGCQDMGRDIRGWFGTLAQNPPFRNSAMAAAKKVADMAILRGVLTLSSSLRDLAVSGMSGADVMQSAEQQVFDLGRGLRRSGTIKSLADIVSEQMDVWEARYLNGEDVVGVTTGLVDLDDKLKGLQPGAMYVIGARPGMGKTSLAMDIATAVARAGKPVLAFSLEMRHGELVDRIASSFSGIPGELIKTGRFTDQQWLRVGVAAGKLAELPFDIDDDPRVSLSQIRSRARWVKSRRQGLGLIVLDYIQLMELEGKSESRQQEIAKISRDMKILAREMECPVLVLAQLNRKLEERMNKRPLLSDLKDSGSLEQDADVVIFPYRDEMYDPESPDRGVAELIIAKHRSGALGTVRVTYRAECTRFDNMAKTPALPSGMPALGAGYDGGSDARDF